LDKLLKQPLHSVNKLLEHLRLVLVKSLPRNLQLDSVALAQLQPISLQPASTLVLPQLLSLAPQRQVDLEALAVQILEPLVSVQLELHQVAYLERPSQLQPLVSLETLNKEQLLALADSVLRLILVSDQEDCLEEQSLLWALLVHHRCLEAISKLQADSDSVVNKLLIQTPSAYPLLAV
jgi:hypothetical protein